MRGSRSLRGRPPVVKPQQYGSWPACTCAPACRSDNHPMRQCGGAKSFVDDLGLSRGVVLSRAAASLRSVETKPFDWQICPLWTDASVTVRCKRSSLPCDGGGGRFIFLSPEVGWSLHFGLSLFSAGVCLGHCW